MPSAWERYMKRAAAQLSRACAETAANMSGGETAVRELAGAMKELTALHAALEGKTDAPQNTIQVSFDRDGELWRE